MSVTHRIGLIFGIVTTVLSASLLECNAADFVGKLYCANGDTIPGRLLSADGKVLRWRSPLFKEPLALSMSHLDAVVFDRPGGRQRKIEPYRVSLRNGNVLHGEIKDINEQHVVLASSQHGQIAIDRSMVRSLRRMDNSSAIYDGPIGLAGWQILEETPATRPWTASDDGQLSTQRFLANLFQPLDLPDQAAIEVTLRTDSGLAFSLAFTDQPSETIRVETWDRELVMTVGHEFEPIATLEKYGSQEYQLRLRWDRKSGTLTAYSKDGRQVATWSHPPSKNESRPGFYIQNKGSDLTLARLRVTRWTGEFPREAEEGRNYIRLADGRIVYGRIEGFDVQQKKFRLETESGEQQIAANDVDSIYPVGEAKKPDDNDKTEHKLVYSDGTRLTGVVTSMADGSAAIQTTYCAEPIKSDLRGIARLSILNPVEESNDGKDQLYCDGGILHGSLVRGGDSNNEVHWQQAGGIGSNSLARECEASLVRAKNADQEPFDPKQFGDTLFLTNCDTIPCRIKSLDKDFVHVHTTFTDMLKVPHEQVKAVELAPEGPLRQRSGFGTGWRVLVPPSHDPQWNRDATIPATDVEPKNTVEQGKGIVRWDAGKAVFSQLGRLGHDSMMRNEEFQFDLQWDPADTVYLSIWAFADLIEFDSSEVKMNVVCSGNTIFVKHKFGAQVAELPEEGTAAFKIQVEKSHLQLMINNKPTWSFGYDLGKHDGRGFAFHLTGCEPAETETGMRRGMRPGMKRYPNMLPPTMRPEGMAPPSPKEREGRDILTISGFEASQSNGEFSPSSVDQRLKRLVLTVPRFSKRNRPKHILIGSNGDLLRGELSSLNDETLDFVSRRDTITLPRSRVSAVVWLHEDKTPAGWLHEDKTPAADNTESPSTQAVLNDGSRITVTPETMGEQSLIGNSPSLGRCKIPVNAISELHIGGYGKLDAEMAYAGWRLQPAREPRFPDAVGVKAAPGTTLVGKAAPNFKLGLLDGGEFQLSQHAGKVVVLHFWATWCGSCVRAMPEYLKVMELFGKDIDNDKVLLVGINQGEGTEVVREFLKRHGWKMTVAMDPDQRLGSLFKVSGMPHSVIIGKDGTVKCMHVGFNSDAPLGMKGSLEVLLQEMDVAKIPAVATVEDATVSTPQPSEGKATAVASHTQATRNDPQRERMLRWIQSALSSDLSANRRQMDECLETIMQVCKPSDEQMSRLNTAADGVIVSVQERQCKQFSAAASMIRGGDFDTARRKLFGPPPFSHPLWKKTLDSVLTPKQRATYVAHIDKTTKQSSQQAVDAVVATLTKDLAFVGNAEAVKKIIGPVVTDHIRREISNKTFNPRSYVGRAMTRISCSVLKAVPAEQLQAVFTKLQWARWQNMMKMKRLEQTFVTGGIALPVKRCSESEYREVLRRNQEREFRIKDRDGNGKLTPEEFQGLLFGSDTIPAAENPEFIYKDEDGDGKLTPEEFRKSVQQPFGRFR